ncbi:Protein fmp32, mitochondrial [Cystobasidiomycetes sp. EMM_F5]
MEALQEVVEESIRTMTSNLVTRSEQEKHQYTQRVDFQKLKSEITLLEKQDFAELKAENERLMNEVERLKQRLREEVGRTQAGVRLDLNLEKGRLRDELSMRDSKIKETETRIEGEIAMIRGSMESAKFSILQYIVGSTTGIGALLLGNIKMSQRYVSTTVATPFEIYNTSKFIQLLSLMKWRRSLPIDVGTIAVSPGFVPATRLGREFGLLGQVGSMLMRWTPFATSLEKGAEGIVRAIVQPYSLKESKEAFLGHSDKFEELDNALLDTSLQERWFLTQPQIEEALGLQPCR